MDPSSAQGQGYNQGQEQAQQAYFSQNWLTTANKRENQLAGLVAVAFATEEEATRAIRHRLYIAGISVQVEKLYTTAPTTQCYKCQGFGHLDTYCRQNTRCIYLEPKCANCKEAHTAENKACEVLLAIKNKTTTHTL